MKQFCTYRRTARFVTFVVFLCATSFLQFVDPVRAAATPQEAPQAAAPRPAETIAIPGPLRSFLRMAGVSQKIDPEEVLPLVARNIVVSGYQPTKGKGANKPTEFLNLLNKYLIQARELQALAGSGGTLTVPSCDKAGPLLGILGYRIRGSCGPDLALEASDAERAFLTVDSGFPLADLEDALRDSQPLTYSYASTPVPVLFSVADWTTVDRVKDAGPSGDLLDVLLHDPSLARLYWALARLDPETSALLRTSPGLRDLVPNAAVLDFYGSHLYVQGGRAVVPGGASAESAWKDLAGADPKAPGEFFAHLVAKDGGWLAAYFDALSRAPQTQQGYFTSQDRLKRFYDALRGRDPNPSPVHHSFRPDPGLVLLVSRLQLDANGQPHIPGNVDAWKDVMRQKWDATIIRDERGRVGGWSQPDHVVEGMFAVSRELERSNPLQLFLVVSEIDRGRAPGQGLTPATVRLLGEKYARYGDQFLIFSEFHNLNDASIGRFLTVAESLDRISDPILRANALGVFQANVGLWEILARQGQILPADLNESWQHVVGALAGVTSSAQLFDGGQAALGAILQAAAGKTELSQDEVIALLSGPDQGSSEGQNVRQQLANRMRSVMDDQRLVSLDTVFGLADGLRLMAQGKGVAADTLLPLAGELREFEMPRPLFTTRERTEWASGLYNVRHTTMQMRTDLTKVISGPGTPAELTEARGQLVPFLRDTLVGLNYAYYEPPGAEVLHTNPLFVRSHDFSGQTSLNTQRSWETPILFGRGQTAGGGAHLDGSLADLPYALAQVEQGFIVPENVQSLIWEDLVPGLMTSAVLTRWWGVTPTELHAVALYQRAGEELLSAAAQNEKLCDMAVSILSDRTLPQRSAAVDEALHAGRTDDAFREMMPADTFYLEV